MMLIFCNAVEIVKRDRPTNLTIVPTVDLAGSCSDEPENGLISILLQN
jgi:hypothetical protein